MTGFLFGDYALLNQSGLFDADFYRAKYPDVVKLNLDPLTHYLEQGCREQRDPSASFDTSYYLQQCGRIGETPGNALLHYLTVGARRGLMPAPAQETRLHIDVPRLEGGTAADVIQGGLFIAGWVHSPGGIQSVDISVDGTRIVAARLELPRPDVVKAFPSLSGAYHSGFSAHIPPRAIVAGSHAVEVAARDRAGTTKSIEFQVQVREAVDGLGPWNLRNRVELARSAMGFARLDQLQWHPVFSLLARYPVGAAAGKELHRTLDSLTRQVYPHWRLRLVTTGGSRSPRALTSPRLLAHHAGLADRITVVSGRNGPHSERGRGASSAGEAKADLVMTIAAGDELAADALLEWALASGRDRDAELIYSDELRPGPAAGRVDPFFKPAWSPDLLLATNYLGRAWCIRSSLLDRTGVCSDDLAGMDADETVSRLVKATDAVMHIPSILYQSSRAPSATAKQSTPRVSGRVSIIIPTDGRSDCVRDCVKSLRKLTRYSDLEIICVASAAGLQREIRQWLAANVDKVIGIREPFHWAKFCNRAAAKATGRYLLFLDDGLEVLAPGWLGAMLQHAERSRVGAVGSMLRAPDMSVSEAGLFLRADGRLGRAFRDLDEGDPGYFGLASVPRNVTAVSSNCLLTSQQTFAAAGGFLEEFPPDLSAADFCLRLRDRGLYNVITPLPRLLQRKSMHEAAAADEARFRKRWSRTITLGDPYVNPNLMRDQELPVIESEPFEIVFSGAQLFTPESIRRILVVKLDHIGDCVTALPAVRRLKQHFPEARLTVLCASGTVPLWNTEAAVSEILEFNLYNARSGLGLNEIAGEEQRMLMKRLRLMEFDLAVDLRKQPDSRHVLADCGARYRAGFDHQGRFAWLDVALEWDEDVPLRNKHGHVAHDLVALVDRVALSGSVPPKNLTAAPASLSLPRNFHRRLSEKPLICVHPGAGSEMRQWPVERFVGLIDLLLEKRQFNIALLGGRDDLDLIAQILSQSECVEDVINLAGRVTLAEIPSVLSRSVLFVGNNSGPHHIAAALGVPTVGIHSGVVDATEWGPLGPRAIAVRRRMSCSPCFLEKSSDCQRGMACLTGMSVADVFRVCRSLLPTGAGVAI